MTIRDLFWLLVGLDSLLIVLYIAVLMYWARQWRER